MSNHTSRKAINLHHLQVAAGRERAVQRQRNRLDYFLSGREAIKAELHAINWLAFCFFVSISFISISYLGWAY